jgi:probable F420-dependent oxidoreductase
MKVGVSMFTAEDAVAPDKLACAVEVAGLDSVWFPDHTHTPQRSDSRWPWEPDRQAPSYYADIIDLFVALTAAALATERVRVGSAICVLPQRDPIVAAKQAASIDRLSGGRLDFGVGSGWNAEEMANHGTDYGQRYEIMRDRVRAMKAIWSADVAEYHGDHCDFGPLRCGPAPVQPGGPPVLVAGESRRARAEAIAHADGWLPRGRELARTEIVDEVARFRASCSEAGREGLRVVVVDTAHDPRDVDAYGRAGVDEVVFRIPPTSEEALPAVLEAIVDLARSR